ncbi:MAG: UpxY family transcription antiterminator [Bacteroidales bacterium]|nr:UpxY family transcription antiterminator [Bacteroidales bacterium]
MNKIAVESDVRKEKSSFVNGTNDREAYPKRWVAALVHTNCEKKVATKLDKLGIENYVAIQTEEHQWSDRKKKIDRIVIPMVVFVRLAKNEEDEFRRLPFIMKFITYPGVEELATPIPDEQIEQIQFLLKHSESPVTFNAHIEIGDAVRIVKGPLKGFTGYCCGASNSEVAIHLDMLGYATTYVPIANIEIIS